MTINIILAHDDEYGIGKDGTVPWNHPEDLKLFKNVTTGCTLIVGKVTWNGLGNQVRKNIQKERKIIVISRDSDSVFPPHVLENFVITDSYESAITLALADETTIYIIGGAMVYDQAINDERVTGCLVTRVSGNYACDTHIPFIRDKLKSDWNIFNKMYLDDKNKCQFTMYSRKHQEYNYLSILRDIMVSGTEMSDRTGIGIKSVFGRQLRFDCSDRFPLLTTKKMFRKGIIEELLWFIKGSTDSKILEDKGVNIWRGNTSREYLDSHGFPDRAEGDIGPGYGHQWRHWNAPYTDCNTDYSGSGIDQLNDCIKRIENEKLTNVHDRRNIMIAWNPEQIDNMSLPPCHVLVQFYLCDNELSLHMYQRSADMFLGVPFNIASYALLLNLVAAHTQCKPKDLIMSFGDCHIYSNHYSAVELQLVNEPKVFPRLKLDKCNIFEIEYGDIHFEGYESHDAIRAPMAV